MDTPAPERPAAAPEPVDSPADLIGPAYKQILLTIFLISVILIVYLVYLFFFSRAAEPSIFVITIIAGCLGAVFSSLIRIYTFQDLPALLARKDMAALRNLYLVAYSLIPIVVGSIAAAVTYIAIAGQLLQGTLFPAFSCRAGANCDSFAGLINSWGPSAATDYAKIIIWGFISGFSERFVPDSLDKLSKAQDKGARTA